MTEDEFGVMMGEAQGPVTFEEEMYMDFDASTALPASVDWRTSGMVSHVKD
jgi:hypothetical protein